MDTDYSVVLFYSTNIAIKAERLIQKEGVTVKLIPVPRHLSSDCGICLRLENNDLEKVKEILKRERIEYEKIAAYSIH